MHAASASLTNSLSTSALQPCCDATTPPSTTILTTTNTMLSSGLTNSASERPLSEAGAAVVHPHISGSVADFWNWLDDAANLEWAVATFPIEKGYSDRNIFVSKLPPTYADRDLQRMFENFGEVSSAKVMLNVSTGASKETGFVQFANAKDALRARAFLRLRPAATTPEMPEVATQWAQNKHDGGVYGDRLRNARKLFIRNIPMCVTTEQMRAIVTQFGDVSEVTLHADTYENGNNANAAATTPSNNNNNNSGRGTDKASSEGQSDVSSPNNNNNNGKAASANAHGTPKRTMRICFVTFVQPGVAAKACSAIHNTKPFNECGEVPLMAKIAEDNNARLVRHQQGAMHQAASRNGSVVAATAAGAATTTSPMMMTMSGNSPMSLSGVYDQQRSPMSSTGMAGVSPMAPTSWYQFPPAPNNNNNNNNSGLVSPVGLCGSPMAQPPYNTVNAPGGNAAWNGGAVAVANGHNPQPANFTAAIAATGVARLSFQPQHPHGRVSALDPTALTASGTPRALSTTASPSANLPIASQAGTYNTTESRRASKLLASSTASSVKSRIPATTTSAPTSARRASRDFTRSPLTGFARKAARTTSPTTMSPSASGNYSMDLRTTMSGSAFLPSQAATATTPMEAARNSPYRRFSDVFAASMSGAMPHPGATADATTAATNNVLSSASSDSTVNSHHSAMPNAPHNAINVRISPRRHTYGGQKYFPHSANVSAVANGAAEMRAASSLTSPYLSSQAAYGSPTAPFVTAAAALTVVPPSRSRSCYEAAPEEAIVSPRSATLAASRNTPNVTPTRFGTSSQTRYRNNPYGMNIVLEKTHSSTFAEAS